MLVLLLLACATLITLDYRRGPDAPLEPARAAIADVVGPIENVTATVVRPFRDVPGFFRTNKGLRDDLAALQAENSNLRSELATTSLTATARPRSTACSRPARPPATPSRRRT